jgi:hypothetical protein
MVCGTINCSSVTAARHMAAASVFPAVRRKLNRERMRVSKHQNVTALLWEQRGKVERGLYRTCNVSPYEAAFVDKASAVVCSSGKDVMRNGLRTSQLKIASRKKKSIGCIVVGCSGPRHGKESHPLTSLFCRAAFFVAQAAPVLCVWWTILVKRGLVA